MFWYEMMETVPIERTDTERDEVFNHDIYCVLIFKEAIFCLFLISDLFIFLNCLKGVIDFQNYSVVYVISVVFLYHLM